MNIARKFSLLAALSSAYAGAAMSQTSTPASLPPEARCASLAVWGEHHTADARVRNDMTKMSLFYLGRLSAKQPERHWSDAIVVDAQRNTASTQENGKAIQSCLHDMAPYLSAQAAMPRSKS